MIKRFFSTALNPRVKKLIEKELSTNKVTLFMKGTPTWPKCGFSRFTSQLLDYYGVEYKSIDVLEDEELRQGIKEYSNWPTIPQVYLEKEFIGGCDIMKQMHESGDLKKLIESKLGMKYETEANDK